MSNEETLIWPERPSKTPDRKYVDPLMEERGLNPRGDKFGFYAVMSREAKKHGMTLIDYLHRCYLDKFGDTAQVMAFDAGVPFDDIVA